MVGQSKIITYMFDRNAGKGEVIILLGYRIKMLYESLYIEIELWAYQ